MIAAGLLRASMLDEPSLNQHLNVALDGLRGNAGFSLKPRYLQAGMGLQALENSLLAIAESTVISTSFLLVISTVVERSLRCLDVARHDSRGARDDKARNDRVNTRDDRGGLCLPLIPYRKVPLPELLRSLNQPALSAS